MRQRLVNKTDVNLKATTLTDVDRVDVSTKVQSNNSPSHMGNTEMANTELVNTVQQTQDNSILKKKRSPSNERSRMMSTNQSPRATGNSSLILMQTGYINKMGEQVLKRDEMKAQVNIYKKAYAKVLTKERNQTPF